jgi:hypothetical protein
VSLPGKRTRENEQREKRKEKSQRINTKEGEERT